ncbi:MAG: FAD-dependent oxidoreductase, partial [Candidatus Saganbacteria bacterium]|nr:FAD-dependent oxidoreductase [Candidatus Saganbacteria bacterium]
GEKIQKDALIEAKGKKVVVVGGGDTGADCVGVANRQGAKCVVQIEVLPEPPIRRSKECPWPRYPLLLKTTTSHEEGVERRFSVLTKEFIGEGGQVKKLFCSRVGFSKDEKGCLVMKELPKKKFEISADLVIIAIGFLNPEHHGLLKELGVKLDDRRNVKTGDDYMTSVKGVFSAGDMRRGQSLIVWALYEGSQAAAAMDKYIEEKR